MTARIYVVGRPVTNSAEILRFLARETKDHAWLQEDQQEVHSSEALCELAGRLCYMSFGASQQGRRTNQEYLANILASGHGSVLEHANWNLIFAGISRTCSHELVRHRAGWSYSQLSQRYVDESDVEFVMPEAIAASENSNTARSWSAQMEALRERYSLLVHQLMAEMPPNLSKRDARIAARQAARSVLPNAAETKIFVTANARALRHFLTLRGSKAAEPEIRALAHQLLSILQGEAPHIFGDLHIQEGAITSQ